MKSENKRRNERQINEGDKENKRMKQEGVDEGRRGQMVDKERYDECRKIR